MSKNRNRRHHGAATPVQAEISPDPKAAVANALAQAQTTIAQVQNDLASAIGLGGGMIPTGYPGNQGSPLSEQVSQPTTIFKNLRWYLVSNMRQVLSEAYVELGLVQAIVDLPVDDALRGGIEIKSKQLSEEQIGELLVSLDRDNDLVTAGQAAKWNRLYGGAGLIVLTDQDPEEPLDLKSITKDTPLEFRAADMWELFRDKQNTEGYDPTIQEESFETYNYYGEPIHKSRVMRLKGIEAPSFIRPRLRGWGFSVVEILVRSINQYLKATDLAFEVLDEFKVDVYKIKNLTGSLFSDVGERAIQRRVQLANYQKNYQNAITMDSEDDWDHKQLSFAGLGDAMLQIRMQVASDMRMPLTKLFGISAAGFNSGEDDIEVYNAMVESQVRNKLKYDLLRMCEIKCQKLFGFVPDDMTLAFKPLRVMSAEQEENVKNAKFARLLQALQAGQIDQKTFKDAINKENLLGVTLDTSQDDLDGYEDDSVGGDDDGDNVDTDDPGADRADSEKPKAAGTGGAPKGLAKAPVIKSKEAPQAKTANAKFDESKHPRADDGKFGYSKESGVPEVIGKTSAGKDIHSYFEHPDHAGFTESDHADAAAAHEKTYKDLVSKWVDEDTKAKRTSKDKRKETVSSDVRRDVFITMQKIAAKHDDASAVTSKKRVIGELVRKAVEASTNGDKQMVKLHVAALKGLGVDQAEFDRLRKQPADDVETLEVGDDGEFSTDLTEEQEATARARFSEAARGPEKKNPSTETPDETSERQHKLEKATREKATDEYKEHSAKEKAARKPKTENAPRPVVMPKRYNRKDHVLRALLNSAAFDLASYRADGGDDWIDERREELFSGEKAQDKALWEKAKEASLAALGRDQWQFVVWFYKKQGGKFH